MLETLDHTIRIGSTTTFYISICIVLLYSFKEEHNIISTKNILFTRYYHVLGNC